MAQQTYLFKEVYIETSTRNGHVYDTFYNDAQMRDLFLEGVRYYTRPYTRPYRNIDASGSPCYVMRGIDIRASVEEARNPKPTSLNCKPLPVTKKTYLFKELHKGSKKRNPRKVGLFGYRQTLKPQA